MGIKNLHQFLRKACPLVYNEVHLSKYSYKKVAIDTSIYMCKFKTTYGKQWLDAFMQLATIFRENEVHPVFVYDTSFPPEKEQEKKIRTAARFKTKEKADTILSEWEQYKSQFAHESKYFISSSMPPLPLPIRYAELGEELKEFLMRQYNGQEAVMVTDVDRDIDHLISTLLSIRTEDFDLTRRLFTLLGIAWINAPGEAEATCAVLNRTGYVDAVLSEDTDVLNYRASKFLHRLNLHSQMVIEIDYENMIRNLDMSKEQFLDFCIMCGTDYNTNLYKIGPEKSYRLLKKHGSLEQIQHCNSQLDMSQFPFRRVREIFLDDQSLSSSEHLDALCYTGTPDTKGLLEFCFENNCRFDIHLLFRAFTQNPHIIFQTEDESIPPIEHVKLILEECVGK
jgi:5'-3' exonuclease